MHTCLTSLSWAENTQHLTIIFLLNHIIISPPPPPPPPPLYTGNQLFPIPKQVLRTGPFWSPCRCVGTMPCESPNTTCSGLHSMLLDDAIRQVFALCIAPVAARATDNNTTAKKYILLCWPFLMAIAIHWYNTEHIAQWRRFRFRALLETMGRRHWESICSDSINRTRKGCLQQACQNLYRYSCSWAGCPYHSHDILPCPQVLPYAELPSWCP